MASVECVPWADDFVRPLLEGQRPRDDHKEFFTAKLEVKDSPGSGRGIFVKSSVSRGELLLLEAACCENDAGEEGIDSTTLAAWQCSEEHVRRRWSKLSTRDEVPVEVKKPQPIAEWAVTEDSNGPAVSTPSVIWLSRSVLHNGMAGVVVVDNDSGLRHIGHPDITSKSRLSLYPVGGISNHSCYPSAEKLAFPSWLVMRAVRPLEPGAELAHAYIDVRCPLHVRRAQLQESWGFSCKCKRCLLEEEVWADKKLHIESVSLWTAFTAMMEQKRSGLQAIYNLVQTADRLTNKALEQYLAREVSGRTDHDVGDFRCHFQPAFELTARQAQKLMSKQDPGKGANPTAIVAFRRLRNILLASYWLAPAMQYAHGLMYAHRFDQCLDVASQIVGVLQEVQPCSSLHVATTAQMAVCAADAARPQREVFELLANAAEITDAAYGDGFATLEILMEHRLAKGDPSAQMLGRILKTLSSARSVRKTIEISGGCKGDELDDSRKLAVTNAPSGRHAGVDLNCMD